MKLWLLRIDFDADLKPIGVTDVETGEDAWSIRAKASDIIRWEAGGSKFNLIFKDLPPFDWDGGRKKKGTKVSASKWQLVDVVKAGAVPSGQSSKRFEYTIDTPDWELDPAIIIDR
jgi:hypothetical protein